MASVILFAVVGLIFLRQSKAVTFLTLAEAESGVVVAPAVTVSDATSKASGGKAVKFDYKPTIPGNNTGGSGGPKTDRTSLGYTANGVVSSYHLYAAGLDWTKRVGIMIYTDGSGEYGLRNPDSSYLLAGTNGMVNAAKKNNMILLTPLAPGADCPDGDGTCWYETSSGITPIQKTQWAEALAKYVHTQYPISLDRVAFGGYSSGAQLASRYWIPSGAAQRTMSAGVIVSISCGGDPAVAETAYTSSFKSNVHMNWNTGDNDGVCPHTTIWSTAGGYAHYTNAGLQTSRDILSGVTHDRSGEFGDIMDAQVKKHVATP